MDKEVNLKRRKNLQTRIQEKEYHKAQLENQLEKVSKELNDLKEKEKELS